MQENFKKKYFSNFFFFKFCVLLAMEYSFLTFFFTICGMGGGDYTSADPDIKELTASPISTNPAQHLATIYLQQQKQCNTANFPNSSSQKLATICNTLNCCTLKIRNTQNPQIEWILAGACPKIRFKVTHVQIQDLWIFGSVGTSGEWSFQRGAAHISLRRIGIH